MRFGEYLVSAGLASPNDILLALNIQLNRRERLGRIALSLGYLNVGHVIEVLGEQSDRSEANANARHDTLFGELAIELGFLNQDKLDSLLEHQRKSKPDLGHILVGLGVLTEEQLHDQRLRFSSNE